MNFSLPALGNIPTPGQISPQSIKPAGEPEAGLTFDSLLQGSIGNVEKVGKEADQSVEKLLNGQSEDVHKVALATQKAEIAFDLFLQVRNKVVQAYQEVMRLQM